jgi:hypothetical protein
MQLAAVAKTKVMEKNPHGQHFLQGFSLAL